MVEPSGKRDGALQLASDEGLETAPLSGRIPGSPEPRLHAAWQEWLRALATEAALVGEPWNADTVRAAAKVLAAEGTPISDHRASSDYRSFMLGTALVKRSGTGSKGSTDGDAPT